MYSVDRFEFTINAPERADVTIDRSTRDKQQLFEQFALGLSFPDYFGENWNALIDCLSDLTWFKKPEALIDHAGVPQLSENDLKLYLESLVDAADRRTADMLPRLRILFRVKDREAIASALVAS